MPPLDWRGRAALWGGEAGPKMTGLVLGGVSTHRPGVPGGGGRCRLLPCGGRVGRASGWRWWAVGHIWWARWEGVRCHYQLGLRVQAGKGYNYKARLDSKRAARLAKRELARVYLGLHSPVAKTQLPLTVPSQLSWLNCDSFPVVLS